MDELTRRAALQRTAGANLLASLVPAAAVEAVGDDPVDVPKEERGRVLSVGMTEGEADCWELAANLAGKFCALPQLHPLDKQEVATAIHVVQNKLLSRPTYRRYLESFKAAKSK
jgi:hypothetical protein